MRYPVMLLYTDEALTNEHVTVDGTRHMIWGGATARQITIPVASTISNYKVDFQTAPGAGTSRSLPFIEASALNSLSITIADAATSGTDSDTEVIAAGNALCIRQTLSGAAVAPGRQYIRFLVDSNEQYLGSSSGVNLGTSTGSRYAPLQGAPTAIITPGANAEQVFPTATTLSKFYAGLNGTLTSGSCTATLVKNGTDTAVVLVMDSSNQTRSDLVTTVSVAAGDLLYWRFDMVTPSTSRTMMLSCSSSPTVAGEAVILTGDETTLTTGTVYNGFYGMSMWDATELNVQNMALGCTFKKMMVHLSAAPGAGTSRTVTFRKGGVDTALTTTIADAATTGTVTANVAVADGDLLSISEAPTGAAASARVKYGLVYHIPSTGYPKTLWFS